jgi:small subunit ribosomal protein S2
MTVTVSLKELVEAGAHFGHQSRRWNPKIREYIYTVEDGSHLFDLTKTKEKLEEALAFLTKEASEGKTILFVGTKKQAKVKTKEIAKEIGMPYVTERWLGGILTNFDQIRNSIKKLADMKKKKEEGEYKKYTKKERILIDREIDRLERFFGGMSFLNEKPDVLVIIDTKKEAGAVKEATKEGVEVVGVVDSNSDPTLVDYPVPMNDDATKAIDYVMGLFAKAIMEGKKKIKKPKEEKEEKKNG